MLAPVFPVNSLVNPPKPTILRDVAEFLEMTKPPVWEVVEAYLKAKKVVKLVKPNTPRLVGVQGNPGLA